VIETEPEAVFEELDVDAPRVGIIMGSKSDMEEMEKAGAVLQDKGIRYEIRVMSAHRDPDQVADYCRNARMRGLKVIIAGAGLSAALPGVAAAHSDLPVIGVPLSSRLSALGGLDAVLSIVQMPPGVPVAAVGLDNARNAGHLAARILSL
jgi:phosphoribosylaminoimidazole carboxylase PurE protein